MLKPLTKNLFLILIGPHIYHMYYLNSLIFYHFHSFLFIFKAFSLCINVVPPLYCVLCCFPLLEFLSLIWRRRQSFIAKRCHFGVITNKCHSKFSLIRWLLLFVFVLILLFLLLMWLQCELMALIKPLILWFYFI